MLMSETMFKALECVDENDGGSCFSYRFATLDALRRRGLVERYTKHIIRAEYVTHDSAVLQFKSPARAPHLDHDWYITKKGRSILADSQP